MRTGWGACLGDDSGVGSPMDAPSRERSARTDVGAAAVLVLEAFGFDGVEVTMLPSASRVTAAGNDG